MVYSREKIGVRSSPEPIEFKTELWPSVKLSEGTSRAPPNSSAGREQRDDFAGRPCLEEVSAPVASSTLSAGFAADPVPWDLTGRLGCLALALGVPLGLLAAPPAFAGEGMLPIELFQNFLEQVEALGPLGAVFFTGAVLLAEMIPLFPTQPLSLAAGLLFGGTKGAGLVLAGNIGAATAAFLLARGVGRSIAERVIDAELEGEEGGGAAKSLLGDVKETIESGSEWQQFMSVLLLRLTPVVPFSASNYVLGLSPLPFLPFFAATLTGMTPWALLFASIGGAGRSLLDGGEDLQQVFSKLAAEASAYTEDAALAGAGVLAVGAAVWLLRRSMLPQPPPEEASSRQGTRGSKKAVAKAQKKEKRVTRL
eukprot:CAMPEP_0177598100 /NCGR_PEP_ID=MMETSP0419_2-20121207/12127_1 /TAXON_ID=582737 /ORGANISM="Tetraselmis sp., Strain GSL018" /LENGTH=366 /DNA_ID=CAMNT_0019090439 /DNA_START=684 /DNA_END=1785 /DNA_ORIENTATION=-